MNQQRRRILGGTWTLVGSICLVLLVLALVVPVQAAPQPTGNQSVNAQLVPSAKVTVNRAFVWAGPGRGFWVISLLSGGEIVPITGLSADRQWWQVTTQDGSGYISYLDVTTQNADNVAVVDPGPVGKIIAGRVIVRGGPGVEARQVGSASRGMQFFLLGARPDGAWVQIKYRFGTGWVKTSLTDVSTVNTTNNAVTVPVTAGEPRVIVNAGALNVRTGPGLIFVSLGKVTGGTTMKIIGKTADGVWLQVESPFGKGWVNSIHVITKDYFGSVPVIDVNPTNAATEATFKALGGTANFRSGPGITFDVVFTANAGSTFKLIGQSTNGWWLVQGANGTKGWVNKLLGQAFGAVSLVPFVQ